MYDKKACDALGADLDAALGQDESKALFQDLALVIADHKLTRNPELCEKVFRYMSYVVFGWNERYRGQSRQSLQHSQKEFAEMLSCTLDAYRRRYL